MTTVGQKLRVIPPNDDDFSVSVVKTSPDGLIAPGMTTSYTVFLSFFLLISFNVYLPFYYRLILHQKRKANIMTISFW